MRGLPILSAFAVAVGSFSAVGQTYPIPEPLCSGIWSVTLDGETNGVCRALTEDPTIAHRRVGDHGGEYAFTSFAMMRPVRLVATLSPDVALDCRKMRLVPSDCPVAILSRTRESVTLQIASPCRFSIEPSGRRHPLLVFAEAPETDIPDRRDPSVRFFGPGLHEPPDGRLVITNNETLYLAPGAVVRGGLQVKGANARVCGRGILDGSPWSWRKGPFGWTNAILGGEHVRFEGVTILGPWSWSLVIDHSQDVVVRNVKICGGRCLNDDGIDPCNSCRIRIEDCFIRTDDDCISPKGLKMRNGELADIAVRRCQLWCDRARPILVGHECNAPAMRNILFEDIDILHAPRGVAALVRPRVGAAISNVVFRNVRVIPEAVPLPEDARFRAADVFGPHAGAALLPAESGWRLVEKGRGESAERRARMVSWDEEVRIDIAD